MLKITPRFNLVIKIAAIVLLSIMVINRLAVIANISSLRFGNIYMNIAQNILFVLMPLYIAVVLRFFGEKKIISWAFLVFTGVIIMLDITTIAMGYAAARENIVLIGVFSLIAILGCVFAFITSLFVKSRVILGPIIVYTTCMLVVIFLNLFITVVFPLIAPGFETLTESLIIRRIAAYSSGLTLLMPVAVILLTNRLNKFSFSEHLPDGQAPEY